MSHPPTPTPGASAATAPSAPWAPASPAVEPPATGFAVPPPGAGDRGGFAVPTVPPRPRSRWRRRWMRLLSLAPLLPLAAAVWWVQTFNPTDTTPDPTGPCAWHALTGINGPACGGTRAFYYLLHGNLIEAVRFHLPFVLAVPFVAYWWLAWAVELWFGRRLPALRPRRWLVIGYAVFFVLFTVVLRNLPVPGLHWFDIPNLTHRVTF